MRLLHFQLILNEAHCKWSISIDFEQASRTIYKQKCSKSGYTYSIHFYIHFQSTKKLEGQVKNNEANLLQNGLKTIYLWYISTAFLTHHGRVNSLHS